MSSLGPNGVLRGPRRIQPLGLAVFVVLLLPDRHARLDLVHDPPARLERGLSMRGRGLHSDSRLPEFQLPHAVHARRPSQTVEADGFRYDLLAFGKSQLVERLVLQGDDLAALVLIADPASEADDGAGVRFGFQEI